MNYIAGKKLIYQVLVGFSLEAENLLENAHKKLRKNLGMMIANNHEALGNHQSQISIMYPSVDKIPDLEIGQVATRTSLKMQRAF